MGFKILYEKKQRKSKKVSKTEEVRYRYQYTKKAVNVILFIFLIIALSSCYINLKNGFSMDTIFTEASNLMWRIIGFYCIKSVTETYLENKTKNIINEEVVNQNNDLGSDI